MTLTWRHVARKDFEDAVRSRLLWGLTATFVGLMSLFLVILVAVEGDSVPPLEGYIFLGSWSQFFVPLIALIVGYMAIVGERRSGSLRMLLSYPFSRESVVLGKVIGRTAVVTITILVGFAVVSAIVMAVLGVPDLIDALVVIGVTAVLGLTFTAAAVGISAGTSSRGTAMAIAVGLFFVLFILWEAVAIGLYYAVNGTRPGLVVDSWYLFIRQLNPIEAYRATLSSISGQFVWPIANLGLEDIPMEAAADDRMVAERVDGNKPFYLHPWFSGVVYAIWIVVPVTLGYLRFRGTDLE